MVSEDCKSLREGPAIYCVRRRLARPACPTRVTDTPQGTVLTGGKQRPGWVSSDPGAEPQFPQLQNGNIAEPTSEAYCDYLNDMTYPACGPEEGVLWLQPTCHRRKLSRGSVGEDTWVRAKPQGHAPASTGQTTQSPPGPDPSHRPHSKALYFWSACQARDPRKGWR